MNLFKLYNKPEDLTYGDRGDSIPIIVWDKYESSVHLEKY